MTFETSRDLTGKHYVVTGANSGIGFVAADNFASRGATVALVCRDTDLGNRALDTIRHSTHDAELKLFIADFASLHSVASLAKELMHTYSSIDVLCNNAGGANSARQLTADGFETTFAVNHLAGFALTQQLMPSLLKAAETGAARVVFTSSVGHTNSALDFDDLNLVTGYGTLKAYGRSKLMNLLTARELDRRFGGQKLIASSFHPGTVRTPIWRKSGVLAGLLGFAMYPFMRSSDKGAETLIWLAAANDEDAINARGAYFFDCKKHRSAAFATDAAAQQLWRVSDELIQPFVR